MKNSRRMHRPVKALIVLMAILLCLVLASCVGNGPSIEKLKTYRDLSWEGTELTVKPGTQAFLAADADLDGVLTPADARLILRASVGLEFLY